MCFIHATWAFPLTIAYKSPRYTIVLRTFKIFTKPPPFGYSYYHLNVPYSSLSDCPSVADESLFCSMSPPCPIKHRAGHRIPNLCLGAGVLLRFRFMKCGFLGVPFKIYSINIVDSTHYSVVLSVTLTRFL